MHTTFLHQELRIMRGKTLEQLVAEAQEQIGHTAAETLKIGN